MRYQRFGVVLCGALLGCGGLEPPGVETQPSDELDAAMLRSALDNQASLEANGQRLLGRVWFARDGYGALYQDAATGATLGLFFARAAGDATNLQLVPHDTDTFDGYVARLAGRSGAPAPRYLQLGATSGNDVALFVPAPPETGGTATAAQAINEFCPRSAFDTLCAGAGWGYPGSRVVNSWNAIDRTARAAFSGTGSSYITVLCADKGDATLTVGVSNGRQMLALGLGVPQGAWSISFQADGMGFNEFCASSFLGLCLDYMCRHSFIRPTITVASQSVPGGNYHSCGKILTRDDIVDDDCAFHATGSQPQYVPKFLNGNDCANFCALSCARSCAGITGPGQAVCAQSCGSSCGQSCR